MPRVSVIVPTRNRRALLGRALASVLGQRFRDFELLVVDDASTDGTAAWLREAHPDVRLIALERQIGGAAARNRGLERAVGKWIAFLDDDDVWQPGFLQAQIDHLEQRPAADLSYADHFEVGPSGRCRAADNEAVRRYPAPLVWLLSECFVHTLSVVVCRREAFDRHGQFDERLRIVHDLEWYARVLGNGGTMVRLPRLLVRRTLPGGLVGSSREWFREERRVLDRCFALHPELAPHVRTIRACRALFFARLALGRGEPAFALRRLAEAVAHSPSRALQMAAVRLSRRVHAHRRDGAATRVAYQAS